MKQISIIGAGFAALSAARKLRQLNAEVEISLIAPKAELIYLPSLIWIPSGKRKADDVRIPLHRFLHDNRIRFVAGEATGLENGGRTVLTNTGKVENDGLIIACGGRLLKSCPASRCHPALRRHRCRREDS